MRSLSAPLRVIAAMFVVMSCGSASQLGANSSTPRRTTATAAATIASATTAAPTAAAPTTAAPTTAAPTTAAPTTSSPSSSAASASQPVRCPAVNLRSVIGEQMRTNAADAQAALATTQPDLQAADVYGHAHPDEWMGVAYNLDPARVTVSFSGHVADHRVALATVVAHPDLVDVVQSPHTPQDVQRVAQEMLDDIHQHPDGLSGYSASWSPGAPAFYVEYGPGEEARAAAAVQRWGDLVDVEVAGRPYVPAGCCTPSPPLPCPDLSAAKDPAPAGISVTIVDAPTSIHRTGDHGARLIVTNVGSTRFTAASGLATGDLFVPGSDQIVGMYTNGVKAIGILIDLAPGESKSIDVSFSAASCGDQTTTAVPPGTYGLRAVLPDVSGGRNAGYLSDELLITVTA